MTEARCIPAPVTTALSAADSANPADIDELQIALELGAALARACEEECVWRVLANALRQLPGVDTAAVFVVDEVQHRLVAARTSGSHARLLEGLSMAVGERMSGWAAATCQSMINADAALDMFDLPASGLRAATAVPCSGPSDVQIVLTFCT